MSIKKYTSLTRSGILDTMQFRLALYMTVVGNMVYLLIIYNLWKAIFATVETSTINGMTFRETMIYLVFASALANFMETWLVFGMGRNIQTGQIALDLLKPMRFQTFLFFNGSGEQVVKFLTTFLPTAVVVFIVKKGSIHLGINLIFFVVSVVLSVLVNFYINFFVGTICLYTQSVWGINIMKDVLVALLSGATIPIAFFPETARRIVMFLPFQAICNTPLNLLIHADLSYADRFEALALQLFWVVALCVLSGLFFNKSVKQITVNGG